ncbi:MAG: MBL fold metallo-hydrolase [Acidobacteria bacterium]|nr:MBL fold metallo-hydrolase [Acidobacteriota bacterium]
MRRVSRQAVWFTAVTLVVLGAGALHSYVAQSRFDEVKIEAEKVADGIYMLKGAGGNMGVSVGEDGVFLIDDQYGPLSDRIKAAIKELGGGAPAFLLNTHYHGDHTGGNSAFDATTPILAHDNVRARLVAGHQPFGGDPKPAPPEALPDLTYSDTITLHFNGEKVEVVHYPNGHTDGDSVIFFTGSDVVHMGDDMFAGMFPFVDLSAGGSVQGLARNVESILGRIGPETKLIPGHGPVSTKKDLEGYLKMLRETLTIVQKRMDAGQSLEQIKEAGLPEQWDALGQGFIKTDRWLETLYNSLKDNA